MSGALPRWTDATPEERGAIRQLIHRRLTFHHAHTAVALMHACGIEKETVDAALKTLVESKAVTRIEHKPTDLFAAVHKPG